MIKTVLLAGCGKMGSALLARWREKFSVTAVDPAGGEKILKSLAELPRDYTPDAVMLAVKPQAMDNVLPEYATRFGAVPLYISIAAGKTLSYYEQKLGKARIIRAMPNTPALVGQGMTALLANPAASTGDRADAEALFALAGQTLWLEDEEMMHAATAISGSGPAYVFLFLEALAKAAEGLGFPPQAARRLAIQTLAGAASLAAAEETGFADLRAQVTSPGGTTEAALKVLMQNETLSSLLKETVAAAVKRSKKLA